MVRVVAAAFLLLTACSADGGATSTSASATGACEGGTWNTSLPPLPGADRGARFAFDGAGTAYLVGDDSIVMNDASGRSMEVTLSVDVWRGHGYRTWISLVEGDPVRGVWLASPLGVIRVRDDTTEIAVTAESLSQVLGPPMPGNTAFLSALAVTSEGRVIIGFATDDHLNPESSVLLGLWTGTGFDLVDLTTGFREWASSGGVAIVADIVEIPGGLLAIGPNGELVVADTRGVRAIPPSERGVSSVIAVGADGSIWIGHESGVDRYVAGEWLSYTDEVGDQVYSLTVATSGALWAGTPNDAFCFDGETWTRFEGMGGLKLSAPGSEGQVWFVRVRDGDPHAVPIAWFPG